MATTILIADDDPVQRRLYEATLARANLSTIVAEDGQQAIDALQDNKDIGAVILDLVMPGVDGIGVLQKMQEDALQLPVIVQTAQGSMETAIRAMRAGAFDFLVKPASPEKLLSSVSDALKVTHRARKASVTHADATRKTASGKAIIGEGDEMARVRSLVAKAADSDVPVLIEGQSGTGKELVAHAIQADSRRASKPFVIVNCGAMPENLVESILFGHEKGAFTGATEKRAGKFSEANGGTLFLDEVGDLPLDAQVKLLRAIQEGQIEPVGASKSVSVNVRLISATHRDLVSLVRDGKFREDLFYRLNVFPIIVPPLRNRLEDIPALAAHFIEKFSASERKSLTFDDSALKLLQSYDWPGNIRQLENTIFRGAVLASDGERLTSQHFTHIEQQLTAHPRVVVQNSGSLGAAQTQRVLVDDAPKLEGVEPVVDNHDSVIWQQNGHVKSLASVEESVIRLAIDHYGGRMSEVARRLEIGRSTLYRKLKEYEIEH
ncbi:MAG: sigma-54 dependent transcriptional regulator [Pseudomonadota bacterium]